MEMELLRNSAAFVVISWPCFGVVILLLEVWKHVSKLPPQELGLLRFLVLFENTAFMGYPIIRAIYGSTGVFYASVFNLAHNFICFPMGCPFCSQGSEQV